ncbi:MAG: hypothetical protein PHH32_07750 [Eubacteriales bacterium]|nr:hypothetical protein [Eubacteriales bacterium]
MKPGICHVMLRGSNRQRIFHDGVDYRTFMEGLGKYKAQCGFTLYAGCLMPNPPHLLLPDKRRADALQRMRKAGASLNQIVRLTGTSMARVRKAVG